MSVSLSVHHSLSRKLIKQRTYKIMFISGRKVREICWIVATIIESVCFPFMFCNSYHTRGNPQIRETQMSDARSWENPNCQRKQTSALARVQEIPASNNSSVRKIRLSITAPFLGNSPKTASERQWIENLTSDLLSKWGTEKICKVSSWSHLILP